MNAEQELIFAKLLLERHFAASDALRECLGQQTRARGEGRAVPLVDVIRQRGVLGETDLAVALREFEGGLKQCAVCSAFYHVALGGGDGLCRRCSSSGKSGALARSSPAPSSASGAAPAVPRAPAIPIAIVDTGPEPATDPMLPSSGSRKPAPDVSSLASAPGAGAPRPPAPPPPPMPPPLPLPPGAPPTSPLAAVAPPPPPSGPLRAPPPPGSLTSEPSTDPMLPGSGARKPSSSSGAAAAAGAPAGPAPGPRGPSGPRPPSPAPPGERLKEREGAPPSPPLPGPKDAFGDYEIVEVVAKGGMGIVYRARHKELKRVVALKVLREGRRASEDHVTRFIREAKSVAKLNHSNIVKIHEFGHKQGQYFFTMDFIEGESLETWLMKPTRDLRKGVEMLRDIAQAVHYAHEQGVIHRDLKPANILIDAQGRPQITDFGLARNVDHVTALTQDGELLGTPLYMSPEQVRGRVKEVDRRTDVYALGVVLYQILCRGQLPFNATTMVELQWKVVNEEPEAPRRRHPEVPAALESVALKCLEKLRDDRYASAKELAEDLDRWLRGAPVTARTLSTGGRVIRRVKRNQSLVLVLILAVLAVLATVATIFLLERRESLRVEAEDRKRNIDKLDEATKTALDEVQGRLELARALLEARPPKPDDALAELAAAARRLDEAAAPDPRGLPEAEVRRILNGRGLPQRRRDVLRLRGRAEAARGDLGPAAARFEELVALDPGDADAWVELAALRRRLGDDPGAETALERAVAARPEHGPAHRLRGEVLLERGGARSAAEAVKAFSAAIASPDLKADQRVEVRLLRGVALVQAGEDRAGVDELTEAIRAREPLGDPPSKALVHRADARWRLGEEAAAAADYDRALELDPYSAEAYVRRGRFRLETGQYEIDFKLAREDFDRAKAEDDTLLEAWLGRGTAAYFLLDDRAAALDLGFLAGLPNPFGKPDAGAAEGVPAPLAAEAARRLGRLCRARAGDPDAVEGRTAKDREKARARWLAAAERAYARALELEPEHARALVGRGRTLLDLGRVDEAAEAFRRALEASPEAVDALVGAALVALARTPPDSRAARGFTARALAAAPGEADALAADGIALWLEGDDRAAAIRALKAARDAPLGRGRARASPSPSPSPSPSTGTSMGTGTGWRPAETDAGYFFKQGKKHQALGARALGDGRGGRLREDLALAHRFFGRTAALLARPGRARFERGWLLYRQAEAEPARREDLLRAALEELAAAIAANPLVIEAYLMRARIHTEKEGFIDPGAAIRDLDAAESVGAEDAELFSRRGIARLKAGDAPGAVKDLERARDLTDGNLRGIHEALHAAYHAVRDPAKAARALEEHKRRTTAAREQAQRLYRQGQDLHRDRRFKEAIEAYTQATAFEPQGEHYHGRALSHLGLLQQLEAIEDYARALELDPVLAKDLYTHLPSFTQFVDFDRALARAGAGTAPPGGRALEGSRHFLRGLLHLLRVESGQGGAESVAAGIAAFRDALDEQPALAAAYCLRGLLELRARDLKAAQEDLEVAVKLEPRAAIPYFFLAGVFAQKLGPSDLPFAYLEKASELGFQDLDPLRRERSLEPLRLDPRWTRLVGRQ